MKNKENYRVEKLDFLRRVVRASASITRQKNVIHFFTEVDVSVPLKILKKYEENNNKKLSFTGYLAKCFSNTVLKYPMFNSFISGNRKIILNELNISILFERKIGNEYVPEPMVLKNVDTKTIIEVTDEIRLAQFKIKEKENFGNLSGSRLFAFVPGFLLKTFVKLADRNIKMGIRYGKLAITSVGMYSKNTIWLIPHGSATVLLSVGSMSEKSTEIDENSKLQKGLCLTASFDHDLIDGAPAARFIDELIDEIKSGQCLKDII